MLHSRAVALKQSWAQKTATHDVGAFAIVDTELREAT